MPREPQPSPFRTHEELAAIINSGRTVIYKGEAIRNVDDLPAPEDLDAGNADALAATHDDLAAQIARLQARQSRIKERIATSDKGQAPKIDTDPDAPPVPHDEAEANLAARRQAVLSGTQANPVGTSQPAGGENPQQHPGTPTTAQVQEQQAKDPKFQAEQKAVAEKAEIDRKAREDKAKLDADAAKAKADADAKAKK